jgi:diguanylate cyclase (GGDEF)-like protein/PAS domain S-box-containing protein
MIEAAAKPRLSPGQRVLVAVLGLLLVAVQAMLVVAYRNVGNTSRDFGTATDVQASLVGVQRGALKLGLEVERMELPDGPEALALQRGLLERQLDVATSILPPGTPEGDELRRVTTELDGFDAELARLQADPTPARLAASRVRLRDQLDGFEIGVRGLYDASEIAFIGSVDTALAARRELEWVLMGTSGLTMAVALLLAMSLRRRASRSYARAYARLLGEVNERKAAEQALRESEQRFQALVNHASDVFTVIGADAVIRYQSPAIERVLGYPAEETIGRSLLELVDPDDRDHAAGLFEQAQLREAAPAVGELRMRPVAEGQPRRFEMTVTNLLDDPTVGGLVLNYRDITERALYQERLTKQAFSDALTGLPNRALFSNRLDHALQQRGQTVGLLFVDLDHFKVVNDSLGHDAGDQLLRDVTARLSGCLRAGDTLARLGGDEFTVLLPDVGGAEEAAVVARRIEDALAPAFELPGQSVFVTASIGIATGVAQRDRSDVLLRDADAAMYEAKARGRARHAVFDTTMHTRAVTRLAIETDLRRALENDQLELRYQPINWLDGNVTIGAEALLRWRRPDGTLVPPGDFIPVAEETGLIHPIGRWVLHEACRQLAEWRATMPTAAGLSMSVNVSARQLQDSGLVDDVDAALRASGLEPGALILELTESAVVENLEGAASILQKLRWMSVQFAMDDFGTGYSSLSSLSQLPLDILKIDRSFVARLDADAEGRAVVYAIVSLATALGVRVTGEGIETQRQLDALVELGCHHGQGFLLGHPVPPDELAASLRAGAGAPGLARQTGS